MRFYCKNTVLSAGLANIWIKGIVGLELRIEN
jgi:hypothetical protein